MEELPSPPKVSPLKDDLGDDGEEQKPPLDWLPDTGVPPAYSLELVEEYAEESIPPVALEPVDGSHSPGEMWAKRAVKRRSGIATSPVVDIRRSGGSFAEEWWEWRPEGAQQHSGRIEVDVGGKLFVTTAATLCSEDSFFCAMLSGRWKSLVETNQRIFIDRDGEVFHHILSYLRVGRLFTRGMSDDVLERVAAEADFYGIRGLNVLCRAEWSRRTKEREGEAAEKHHQLSSELKREFFIRWMNMPADMQNTAVYITPPEVMAGVLVDVRVEKVVLGVVSDWEPISVRAEDRQERGGVLGSPRMYKKNEKRYRYLVLFSGRRP